MTTIAYKDGVISCDSRETEDTTIVDDDCDKRLVKKGVQFFCSGSSCDAENLASWYLGETFYTKEMDEIYSIVIDNSVVLTVGYGDKRGFYKNTERQANYFAIGSGAHHAITAMDMGCDSKEAVEMASKRDAMTGGKIKSYKVDALI